MVWKIFFLSRIEKIWMDASQFNPVNPKMVPLLQTITVANNLSEEIIGSCIKTLIFLSEEFISALTPSGLKFHFYFLINFFKALVYVGEILQRSTQ